MFYVYMLSYDLNSPGQKYDNLYEELKKSSSWCHPLDSTWLIYTNESATQLFERVQPYTDKNDRLLIIKLQPGSQNRSGWTTQEVWNWLNQHLG